jgi:hypothetical protein
MFSIYGLLHDSVNSSDYKTGNLIPTLNYVIEQYAVKAYGKWKYSSTILNLGI